MAGSNKRKRKTFNTSLISHTLKRLRGDPAAPDFHSSPSPATTSTGLGLENDGGPIIPDMAGTRTQSKPRASITRDAAVGAEVQPVQQGEASTSSLPADDVVTPDLLAAMGLPSHFGSTSKAMEKVMTDAVTQDEPNKVNKAQSRSDKGKAKAIDVGGGGARTDEGNGRVGWTLEVDGADAKLLAKAITDRRDLPGNMQKYWTKRYRLFSLYDQGVLMDKESWFSVTPETVAFRIAWRTWKACQQTLAKDARSKTDMAKDRLLLKKHAAEVKKLEAYMALSTDLPPNKEDMDPISLHDLREVCFAYDREMRTKAKKHKTRVLDLFCGAGGNAIQFAYFFDEVVAIDNDPVKIALAKHNAKIYGVQERITFIQADAVKWLHDYHHYLKRMLGHGFSRFLTRLNDEHGEELRARVGLVDRGPGREADVFGVMFDAVFLSPPWGGVDYQDVPRPADQNDASADTSATAETNYYSLASMQPMAGNELLMRSAAAVGHADLVLYCPRNTDLDEVAECAKKLSRDEFDKGDEWEKVHVEEEYCGTSFTALTCYFGQLANLREEEEQAEGEKEGEA